MSTTLVDSAAAPVEPPSAPELFTWRSLNGLQKMMLRWETFHPLNAVHVLKLAGSPAAAEIRDAIAAAVQRHLPGPVLFSDCQNRFRCLPAAEHACPLEISIHTADESAAVLQQLLHQELNTPFTVGAAWPYRFHAVLCADNTCTLLIVYRHAMQDGHATLALGRTILRQLRHLPSSAPLGLADNLYGDIPGFHSGGSRLKMAPAVLREIVTGLNSWRIRPRWSPPDRFVTGTSTTTLPVSAALATARSLQAKVQDVLLAATHEAMQLIPAGYGRRNRIGLYTPVDIRHEAVPPIMEACGQILGGYTLRFRRSPDTPFAELVQQFCAETQQIKRSGSYRLYERHVNFMSYVWDRLPRWGNRVAGPFLAPISAGLSNMNINQFMAEELQCNQLLDYLRFTGTGIMTSLMLLATTCGDSLNLTTTHHSTLYSDEEMAAVRQHIQARLLGQQPERQ